MWKSCSNAVGAWKRPIDRGKAVKFLPLLLVTLALTSGLLLASWPAMASVSWSVTALAYNEENSRVRTIKVSSAARDTLSFDREATPLGQMKEEIQGDEEAATAEGDHHKVITLEKTPRIEIKKDKPGSINIQIGDEYYEEGKDIVKFGENVEIDTGRVVEGDVVVIGGSLKVCGTIKGDAVCMGGTLSLCSTGVVEGDAVSIGGTVMKEEGAKITGDEVSVGDFVPGWVFKSPWPKYGLRFAGFAVWFMKAMIVLLITWIVVMVLSDRVKRVADTAAKRPLASFGLGLLIFLLTPIAMVLLCITIVGIPVAILLPIGLIIVGFLGYTGIAYAFGRKLFGHPTDGVIRATVVGVLILEAIPLVGKLLCLPGGFLCIIGLPIRIVGLAVIACAISMGMGAAILSKLGQQPKKVWGWIPPSAPGQQPRWQAPPPGCQPPTPGVPGMTPPTPGTHGTPGPGTPGVGGMPPTP